MLLLLLPVALLLLAELVLRLCGFGGYPPFFHKVGPVAGGTLVITDRRGASSWFFANSGQPGFNEQYAFLDPKPTNTFRIFLVGESAAKGYPEPRNLSSSAFLQAMLQDAWPEKHVEVINLGTTAIASFPVLGIMTEALNYDPDLVIVHTGHNEFFGAYGLASTGHAGNKSWMLATTRYMHSFALVQGLQKFLRPKPAETQRSLMESMVGQSYIAPDDWRRAAAVNNLHHNIATMIERCEAHGVPVLVCTMPSSEANLAPIGPNTSDFSATNQARVHFQHAQALTAEGKSTEALSEFVKARDLDTMPWRATSAAQEAILQAANEHNAHVCDLVKTFRGASPGGVIGWELMDDHVHPTLRGQALMAESFVNSMTNVSAEARTRIAPWETYAKKLGENPYDRYGVTLTLRAVFNVPFMRQNNPEPYERLNSAATQFEAAADPEVGEVLRQWRSTRPQGGVKRPLSGMVARVLARRKNFPQAMELFQAAQQSVPEYTSLHMEFVCLGLECKLQMNGSLTAADLKMAAQEIGQGQVLLQQGFLESGLAESYLGRLHQLCGEFAGAIPFLDASRRKLSGIELVAADHALIISYLKTGADDQAAKIAQNGVDQGGQFTPIYRNMLTEINAVRATKTSGTK